MDTAGTSTKQIPVHKKDAEGVLLIDALTGHVVPEQHDRPEWAEGLVLAQLAERHLWYTNRMGAAYTENDAMKSPEMLAFEDLGWLKMEDDGNGELVEAYHDADDNFRMEVLAVALNVNLSTTDADEAFANAGPFAAEVEIARDNFRTDAEMADLKVAQEGRFGDVSEERKTGTHN